MSRTDSEATDAPQTTDGGFCMADADRTVEYQDGVPHRAAEAVLSSLRKPPARARIEIVEDGWHKVLVLDGSISIEKRNSNEFRERGLRVSGVGGSLGSESVDFRLHVREAADE